MFFHFQRVTKKKTGEDGLGENRAVSGFQWEVNHNLLWFNVKKLKSQGS